MGMSQDSHDLPKQSHKKHYKEQEREKDREKDGLLHSLEEKRTEKLRWMSTES